MNLGTLICKSYIKRINLKNKMGRKGNRKTMRI